MTDSVREYLRACDLADLESSSFLRLLGLAHAEGRLDELLAKARRLSSGSCAAQHSKTDVSDQQLELENLSTV